MQCLVEFQQIIPTFDRRKLKDDDDVPTIPEAYYTLHNKEKEHEVQQINGLDSLESHSSKGV